MTRLVVCDIETTGLDPDIHAIIEIACIEVIDGSIVFPRSSLVLPPHPIPPASSAVHHLVDADVADAPFASAIIPKIIGDTSYCIFAAHNSQFEYAFLEGFIPNSSWICTYKSALRVWPEAPGHSNQVLRYWLNLPVGNEAMPPHRALPDCYVTAHLFNRLRESASIEDMLRWTKEPAALPTCPIGDPWRGKPWREVDIGFLQWIVRKEGMESDYVWNAQREMDRREEEAAEKAELDTKRQAYLVLARDAARFAVTTAALDKWWKDQKQNRLANGVTEDTYAYAEVVKACKARKAEILSDQVASR